MNDKPLTNLEKFMLLVSDEPQDTMNQVRWRIANAEMLDRKRKKLLKKIKRKYGL